MSLSVQMCVEQKCVAVSDVTGGLCPDGCGNGVCNSLGHCHCDPGWGPPNCLSPGDGGSIDSGPALDRSGEFILDTWTYLDTGFPHWTPNKWHLL